MSTSAAFPYELHSVRAARRFLREQLSSYPAETVEAAELMLSELATNSIRHAGSGFDVAVRQAGEEIRVEVSDSGAGHPHMLNPRPTDPSGRGLRIVEGLARRWGVAERGDGKTVWFTIVPAPEPGEPCDGDGRRSGRLDTTLR